MSSPRPALIFTPGVCRICACTEFDACVLEVESEATGEIIEQGCAWIDRERTLCSNPECVAQIPIETLKAMTNGQLYENR